MRNLDMITPLLTSTTPEELIADQYELPPQALSTAREIIDSIKAKGRAALTEYAYKYGDLETIDSPLIIEREDLKQAYLSLDQSTAELLQRTAQRITAFAQAQETITDLDYKIHGGRAGHQVSAVEVLVVTHPVVDSLYLAVF